MVKVGTKSEYLSENRNTEPIGKDKDINKKTIQQIIKKLQNQGVNAELCKRSKFSFGS